MSGQFAFELHHTDALSSARRSTFHTPHGPVEMPAFMPVGTQGTVKGLEISQVEATGAQMVLTNTYHLALRPGETVVRDLGGIHRMMGWDGPVLSDSGGFQVFSLAKLVKISEKSAKFRSHIDGSQFELSPERSIAIQETLGCDVAMVLDHVIGLPASTEEVQDACDRTIRWAARCRDATRSDSQAQFAIIQGGLDIEIRQYCAGELAKLDFAGYAIGGLSVGESPDDMYRVLDGTCPAMPADRPRYLMGVGRPIDLLEAIRRGVDLFDCVIPTRNGRNALAYTAKGPLKLRNEKHRLDDRPLEADCPCVACRRGRGYLRHLFASKEMLGPILLSIHNLTYYQRLLAAAREAISADRFVEFYEQSVSRWQEPPELA